MILINCSHGAPNVAPRFFADQILGAGDLLDAPALGAYLAQCQFKFGGISKAPGEHPGEHPLPSSPRILNLNTACSLAIMIADPYHTYLSIAAAAVVSPDPAWGLQPLDPLLNATHETARWAKEHVAAAPRDPKG